MPRGDQTGPDGQGPKTGRGLGNCRPNSLPRELKRDGSGKGIRANKGRGCGRGFGNRRGLK